MKKVLVAAAMILTPAVANAAPIYLDFENIAPYPNNNNVSIGDYYNGGTSSIGTSGTNYGVQFTTGATLLCLNTAGTTCSNTSRGGQGISTSQFGALYFPSAGATMNVAAGFNTGFAGVYSNPFGSATTVNIYSGLNGTGTLLATTSLGSTGTGTCNTNISGGAAYCPFNNFSLGFSGTAMSVVFGGTVNQQVFDDFTFGSTTVGGAVPEPATWAMMMLGFGALGGMLRRRSVTAARVRFAI
ncbi:MAG: PEP-CTERM sorting domain-containing protein [Sphingomonas sp.]|uniref:PEPxxWA-CTERM sorting domain-containing protein n=1 Tax=Sphingomonas sp. TaxID=28214 RepID=UPI001ACD63FA|nr:PEPxxWA-CTERM sorting domain-containing protein [Sphingomonas sp.]MBN8808314.1 PEP-CTERM sorting domain-containing protein [Sphingomonas sp.]